MNINKILVGLVVAIMFFCLLVTLLNNKEGFYNTEDEVDDELLGLIRNNVNNLNDSQIKDTISNLKQRLINYGYYQDTSDFVRKTDLNPDSGKCIVAKAEDRDLYVAKSSVPLPGPRVDMSKYVKKSSIPPQTVCPPQKEIDYSAYVKKSSLPPTQECPPCIAPKVNVSAGLCQKCPPAPAYPPPKMSRAKMS